MNKRLLISVVGPTASGKSELAVQIAKRFSGEIISADSRQIYKGMDIGTGKVEGKWTTLSRNPGRAKRDPGSNKKVFVYKGIPHYLIDEASPKTQYSVARFQKQAQKIIANIYKQGKLPIICGGTGMWIDAVVHNSSLPEVKPDKELRAKLAQVPTDGLFALLKELDPSRARNIDSDNPRRLIRALEIVMTTGQPVPQVKHASDYRTIWVGLNPGAEKLHAQISKRLQARLKLGMLREVKKLRESGLSWKKLESFGLEYKFLAMQLQSRLTEKEACDLLFVAIKQYAKRQMTWWKRNPEINWFTDSKSALSWTTQRLRKELKS